MLSNTFVHISGIGPTTEQAIWQTGVHTWSQFRAPATATLSPKVRHLVANHLQRQPRNALHSPAYFYEHLPPSQQWRLFPHFRQKTAYLDIETTGISREQSSVTTIALYNGEEVFTFVQGENLDEFPDHLARYDVIVTYNGKGFDVPMLERCFAMKISQAHLDLRPILAALGYKGGLKGCERQLGLERRGLAGVDGYDAVILWHRYRTSGRAELLNTLLAYNVADTINLEPLMVQAYNLHIAATPFALTNYLAAPQPAANPFQADTDLVRDLRHGRVYR